MSQNENHTEMKKEKNPGGRPRDYDRIAVGNQMVEWSKRPDALTVPMFATSIGLHSGILRSWCTQDEQFRALYMQAKENIGINRLKAVTNQDIKLDPGIYKQTMHYYDLDVKEDVRDEKRFEASLKSDVAVDKVSLGELSKVMAAALMSQSSENKDLLNNKTESTS